MEKRSLNIKIVPKNNIQNDLEYWQSKTAEERLSAAEDLRNHFYIINGFSDIPRIEKIISIRKLNEYTP